MRTTSSMSREAIDRMLQERDRSEAQGGVAGTRATCTEDLVRDVVADPLGTLHRFEFRDGLIYRENVWLNGASAIAQLTGSGA